MSFIPRIKGKSKLFEAVSRNVKYVVKGTILCIDPSSASRDSLPGYCIFSAGQYVDSGLIEIESTQALNVKLQQISDSLRNDFPVPDLLVIENIPPFMGNKGGFNRSILNLHKSIGAIIASVKCAPILEVAPVSWRMYIPSNYLKSDENDAIMMGITVVSMAFQILGEPVPPLPDTIAAKLISKEGA